ncbi:Aste57867_20783 [Aphanomyces stellatus]|uniref:Aste57867_20783 protein n=1 Tax=Aphanomyces stellatus TaxID=120398 RepID=A0A485LFS4_9STRA|nr:hypothetical protein As57867_020715 [Aphanomyces stellatus]VFT97462.1 Aste57867_20783 [Aphanomyces stellatus]
MYIMDDEEADAMALDKKRDKKKKKLTPEEEALEGARAAAMEKNKYWAPIVLLFPLGPVCVALTTVVFGGVIINAGASVCNAHLKSTCASMLASLTLAAFMQGAVALSYILILFYAYCWIGPRPITRLRTLRVFYTIYGIICFGWWGVFGSMEAATATSTGYNSCLETAPALYLFSQYQVTIFWLLLVFFLCFACKEMRMHWLATEGVKIAKSKAAADAKEKQRQEEEAKQAAADEAARVQAEKEAGEKKAKAERDRLYQDVGGGEADEAADDGAAEAAPTAANPGDVEEEEEEEEGGEEEEEEDEEEDGNEDDDENGGDDDEVNKEADEAKEIKAGS